MRIWDVDPGYLDRQRLLGEHRELHGLYNIITQGKKGYSQHPETLRWVGHVNALVLRHKLLVEEMGLRGYNHQSPLAQSCDISTVSWPKIFINTPSEQYELLRGKQVVEQGRISLPVSRRTLWAQHKYSSMARDPHQYKTIGPEVASKSITFEELADLLVQILRIPPLPGRIINALQHMSGYIKNVDVSAVPFEENTSTALLLYIRKGVTEESLEYLNNSTALGELGVWI
jgi:hypothetical protein